MIGKKINQLATELAPVSTDLTIIGDPISGVSKKITLAQLGAIFSGAVSFYTNLASFPVVGDINVIYCAKDTQKLYLWSGSAYVEVFPSQALLDTYQLRSEKGVSNGYASLDSGGKVPISQLPSSIMEYKGTWNASTNTPTLANGTGDTGDVYICNVAGTVNFGAGPLTFAVGDYVIYSGSIWQRSSGAVGTVTSVAVSRSGDALAITGSPVTTSGTINIGFAGNSTQYINGAGNLVTFPGVINEAQNLITEVYNKTGATLTKGTVVYINGGQGNLPTITKALATGDSTSAQTYGIVRNDITNNNNGYVVVAGRISDLDTQAFTEGTQLYLSPTTAGTYTSTKAYAPNHLVYVGIVVRAHPTQGVVEVKIQNGYEMDELHNVAAQSPSNNDGLFWEASTSLWKNKSISTILGGTPVTGSGNVNAIPKFTANSVLGNSVMEDDGNFVSMRGLKINAVAGVGNTINFQQGSGITAAGLGYSTIGAASTTGFAFYIDQNTTSRSFILDTSTITSATQLTYSLPASSGTLALASQLTGGTVTSVGLSSATSGVTIGSTPITTSGTITLAIATASGSQQGLLSSTDWTTFNNKQNALTNPVTGTGTTNYIPKFTGASTIGDSIVQDNGSTVTIGGSLTLSASSGFPTVGLLNRSSDTTLYMVSPASGFTLTDSSLNTIYNATPTAHNWNISNSLKMTLNTSGNLGLGVSPSAWLSTAKAIQINSLVSVERNSVEAYVGHNFFYNSSNSPTYIANGFSSRMGLYQGSVFFDVAPSGTAGNAISFTQAMTLDASGNLLLASTSPVGSRNEIRLGGNASGSAITMGRSGVNKALIQLDSGDNLYFENTANANTIFTTNNLVRLTIAGTGAATFSSSVTANGFYANAGNSARFYRGANDYYWGINNDSNNYLNFGTFAANGTAYGTNPKMILLDNGNVGIGTTAPQTFLHVLGSNTSARGQLSIQSNNTSNAAKATWYYDTFNSGEIGTTGSDFYGLATNNFLFYAGGSERMRITSGGNVGIGITNPTYRLTVSASASTYVTLSENTNNVSGVQNALFTLGNNANNTSSYFLVCSMPSGDKMYIYGNGNVVNTNNSYGALSDIRLKENVSDTTSKLADLLKVKVRNYNLIGDDKKQLGVIAQELETIFPSLVEVDGKTGMKQVKYSVFVPMLIKAIQELNDKIK
jgi:hypothetical protein